MKKVRAFFLRLANLFHRDRAEREMAEEMESNLQLHIDENMSSGMSPEQARRTAVLQFGHLEPAKESYRDRRGLPCLETLLQDLGYAFRMLRNNPGFAGTAVLTLALGIGANTAMFSVVQAVLVRPLPYLQPNRLIEITETNPLKHWTNAVAAPANFADWQKMNSVFTGIAAYTGTDTFLSGAGEPERLKGLRSTGNLFEVLGVAPLLGRTFTWDETFEGKDRVAVIGYDLWQTVFAGDPHIVGRTITLTGRTFEVVGVMPSGFFFPNRDARIFVPLGVKPTYFTEVRRPHQLNTIARLRPGVSIGQATGQMTDIALRLERMYPNTNTKMGVRLDGFHDTLTREKRPALLMLLAAVSALFLIVCSNVANLQLGRAAARTREIGIRQALGAGRRRLIQQLLTESMVLSVLGGVLGLGVAAMARVALLQVAPKAIPAFAELRVDGWVILFNAAITLLAPLLFGIVPALTSSRAESLRERSEISSRGSRSVRDMLVVCEVALAVVLVAGAGLLIRSLIHLESVAPGFNPERAVSFGVFLPEVRYPKDEQCVRALHAIETRLQTLPGVTAVGASTAIALRGYTWTGDATPEGRGGDDYERELRHETILPGYFSAIGTPLLRGRFFNERDTEKSAPVAIVNESLERAYFHGNHAVGKRIKFGRPTDSDPWTTVIGVVADQKQDGLDAKVLPEAYSPESQQTFNAITFVVRGNGPTDALIAGARREIHAVDGQLVLTDVKQLDDLVRESVGDQRFRTSLLTAFAGIALFLAALGVYGVLAYSVAQRSKEIGIRLTLGAQRGSLFGMVIRDGMRPVMAGAVLGLVGAIGITSLIKSLLYGVTPMDPVTFGLTIAILAAVALGACVVPASRAMRVDPLESLREQ